MQSTVENLTRQGLPVPLVVVIGEDQLPYTSGGVSDVDKSNKTSPRRYTRDNQTLTIESCFLGIASLKDMIKQYLVDEMKKNVEVADNEAQCYNGTGNIAVAASTKEDS